MDFSKKAQLKYINQGKSEKKKLEKECLELWSELVKARANYKCEYFRCRKNIRNSKLNSHHYFTKGAYPHLKYEPANGLCFCPTHHTLGKESAHGDPNFKEKILGRYKGYSAIRTEKWHTLLEYKAQTTSPLDLKLIRLFLIQELRKYFDYISYDFKLKHGLI